MINWDGPSDFDPLARNAPKYWTWKKVVRHPVKFIKNRIEENRSDEDK